MQRAALVGSSLITILAASLSARGGLAAERARWPHGTRAAVSLTYDDAMESQLTNAGPALDEHRLRATFFLMGKSDSLKNDRARWVALSRSGHELASHTMFHPCQESYEWVPKGFALEEYTLERMSKELDDSIALVHELTSHDGPLTFAYPCGDSFVGRLPKRSSYIPLIEARFLAARGTHPGLAMPGAFSFAEVPMADDTDRSGPALIEWVKKAEAQRGWVVFTFHGVGGQHLPTTVEAHKALLDYLVRNKKTVWTAPFGEVAAFLKSKAGAP
jgi:peptidoglycan/xylan/chitin deacetylase (PgdA/CDA1 family)